MPPPNVEFTSDIQKKLIVSRTRDFFLHQVPDVDSTLREGKWKMENGDSVTNNLWKRELFSALLLYQQANRSVVLEVYIETASRTGFGRSAASQTRLLKYAPGVNAMF